MQFEFIDVFVFKRVFTIFVFVFVLTDFMWEDICLQLFKTIDIGEIASFVEFFWKEGYLSFFIDKIDIVFVFVFKRVKHLFNV